MKHDKYFFTLLGPSYLVMILSSCIEKLSSCDFYNLLERSKYALHISRYHLATCFLAVKSFLPLSEGLIGQGELVAGQGELVAGQVVVRRRPACSTASSRFRDASLVGVHVFEGRRERKLEDEL